MPTSGRVFGRIVAGTMLIAAGVSCSDGDKGEDSTPGKRSPSGEPIVVGFINVEGAPIGSIPALRDGAEAARAYINGELDGVDGRPLEFDVCITNGTPESSSACANKMVERGVVSVLGGVDLGSAASLPILAAAGIPYLGMTPLLPADLTTDGAFTLDPGGLGTAANAFFAVNELDAESVTILHDDSAPGRQLAEAFVRPVLAKGVASGDIELVAEKQNSADMAPAVAAAIQGDPDAVIVVFPPPACARIMQAAAALGSDADMLYVGRCSDPQTLTAGGAGADGAYFFSSILHPSAHADDPDVKTYSDKIEQFGAEGVDAASYDTARGFATTMTFYERLSTLDSDDLTPEGVSAAFKGAVDAPAFMGHPYTCDGRQAVPGFVSVCNSYVRIYQFVDGRYRDASGDWISAGAALTG